MEAMRQFSQVNKFQSVVILFISYNLVEAKSLVKLQDKFKLIDENNDGKISWKEFQHCYKENMPPISNDELGEIFKKLDQNGSGFIDYTCNFIII
jgi:Ca2+-binding EF-hand superfamily protein